MATINKCYVLFSSNYRTHKISPLYVKVAVHLHKLATPLKQLLQLFAKNSESIIKHQCTTKLFLSLILGGLRFMFWCRSNTQYLAKLFFWIVAFVNPAVHDRFQL